MLPQHSMAVSEQQGRRSVVQMLGRLPLQRGKAGPCVCRRNRAVPPKCSEDEMHIANVIALPSQFDAVAAYLSPDLR
jgi:hypothetical protein